MTICPIAIAVGCKKCPAFKFCPLTTVLGDQEEKDEWDRVWEENFSTAEEHLDKINVTTHEVMKNPKKCGFDDKYQKNAEEELEKNKDEIDPSNKVWEENFPTEWDGSTADEHLDKMDELEKNKNEESEKE